LTNELLHIAVELVEHPDKVPLRLHGSLFGVPIEQSLSMRAPNRLLAATANIPFSQPRQFLFLRKSIKLPIRQISPTAAKDITVRLSRSSTMQESVDKVLAGKYPAKAHARRVVDYIRRKEPNATGVLYLEGQKTKLLEDNDEAAPFRLGQ
jgi:hypothetical protein